MKRILVASHVSEVYAPTYPLIRFLEKKYPEPICILHPFKDRLVGLHFLRDFLVTFFLTLFYLPKYDVFIGVNCLNCLAGLFVKLVSPKKLTVYYSADYSTKRFGENFLSQLYIFLDKFCSKRADYCWSVSERIREVKRGFGVCEEKNFLVPNGVHLKDIKLYERRTKNSLLYVGHLTETKGVQDVIKALKNFEGYKLFIIGDGPFRKGLGELSSRLGLDDRVFFLGRWKNKEVLQKIGEFEIGLAPHTAREDYIYYCDPVKVKEYLAAGCPVVVSEIVGVARDVKEQNCGVVVEDFPRELPSAVKKIEKRFREMSQNARRFASQFDWFEIYKKVFAEMGL